MAGLLAGTSWLAAWLLTGWLAAGLLAAWLVPDRLYRPSEPLFFELLFRFLTLSRCIRVELPERNRLV